MIVKIERIGSGLGFITLALLMEQGERKVPVYLDVGDECIGLNLNKVVDISTERTGFLGREIKQEIAGSNFYYSTSLPLSLVRQINDAYSASRKKL